MTRAGRFQPFVYPALLLVILTAFYWKITLTYEYDWLWGPDLTQQVLPWFEEEARQMQHHHFPLWDPHTWAGQPMLGQAQPGAAYPLNWLVFLAPRTKGHLDSLVLQWYFVAIHYMAALFCFLLCRDLGLTKFASLIGGLVFSVGAYMSTTSWPQMINGAVWAPLVFMFLLRTVRGVRPLTSAALCGFTWGMSWLSGHHQVPLFISLAAGLTWIFYALRDRSWRLAGYAAIALALVFLTAALQILPAEEYGRLAVRWVGAPQPVHWNEAVPYEVHRAFSTSPIMVFGIAIPMSVGYTNPFIGVLALTLGVTAIVTAWKRSEVKLFTTIAAGGFAYALGFHNVFQGLLYAVTPLLDKARTPAMAIVIFGFGAAVLTAIGVDQLRVLYTTPPLKRIGWALTGFGIAVWAVAYVVLVAKGFAWPGDDRVIMSALIAVLAAGLLYAWQKNHVTHRAGAVLLTGLMMIELGNVATDFADRNDYSRSHWAQEIRSNREIADFITYQRQPVRVDIEGDALPTNWPEYYNIDELHAYLASLTVNWTQIEAHTAQTKSLFGVGYTIGHDTSIPGAQTVFEAPSGIKVFQNPNAFPRAWAIHELVSITKPSDGQQLIADHLDDLHRKAFTFAKAATFEPCSAAEPVTVTRHDHSHVTIRAAMACDGMVVLSDTFYPGWQATVDRNPATISEVNFAMRAVRVPRGTHEINYVYRPASVLTGAFLSAAGLLSTCLIAFFDRKRLKQVDLTSKRENNQY